MLVIGVLMVVIAVGSFEGVTWYLTGKTYDLRKAFKSGGTDTASIDTPIIPRKDETEVDDSNMKNVLFFVEGEDGLSLYSALVMMNKETKATDILLIPLHVQVTVGGKLLSEIQTRIPDTGSTMALDDIARVYGDEKYRIISDVLSEILGVKIAGYDAMTQDKFSNLLDLAGKVTYQFPNMLSYRNNKQELEYFESGEQKLDGKEAVILMSHQDGTDKQESARLERCNTYLESWTDEILKSAKGAKLIDQVQANASSSEGRDFTEEKEIWAALTPDALTLRILQGAESKGIFIIDSQKAKLQIATLAKQSGEYDSSGERDSVEAIKDDQETVASSKDYYIELYNAAFRSGLASEWEEYLTEEGYNISLIDSYQDEGPLSTTRIIVNQEGIGQDLLKYFPDAYIETDEIKTGGDIRVYIGTDSINVGKSESDSDSSDDSDKKEEKSSDDKKKSKKEDKKDKDDDEDKDKDEDEEDTGTGYYRFDKESD
jgi:anionic cell wall polymer biosynthesis LytR-Cps2A-Psr (LCP) family protein